MFADDDGRVAHYDAAIKWYRLAAKQGSTDAQISLGTMYSSGKGVTQSDVYAHMWFALAASNGDESAIEKLAANAKRLTPQDLSKAQDLAATCVNNKHKDC